MRALEFTTKINEGVIHIPENMKPYYNSRVRIIMLAEEADITVSKKEKLLIAVKNMAGKNMFTSIDNPTQWQKTVRNDW